MRWKRTLSVVDCHAEGESGKVIIGGVGQVPGILTANCTIGVTRGGSVTATAAAMWQRLYGGGRGNAV